MRATDVLVLSGLDGDKDQPHDRCHSEDERIAHPYCRQVLRSAVRPGRPAPWYRFSCCQRVLFAPDATAT
jgi:hypothetical protein